MNELMAYLPYNFLMSAYSLIPALLLLSHGKGPVAIGIVAAISSLGSLLASLFWPKYTKIADKSNVLAIGYLGMFLGSILLQNVDYVYIAAFILAFFPPATYYAVLSEIKAKYSDISKNLSKIFSYGEIANALGYLTGAIATKFLNPADFALLLSFLALIILPIISAAIGKEGILSIVEKGIEEIENIDEKFFETFKVPHRFTKLDYAFLATAATFSLGFGLIYTQLPTIMKKWFQENYMIYTLVMIARLSNSFSVNYASKLKEKALLIGYFIRIIAFSILLYAVAKGLKPLAFLFYLLSGIGWGFIFFFYNYVSLKRGEELVGANVLVRTIAYSISSFFSGFLVKTLGFFYTFATGFAIFIIAPFWYLLGKRIFAEG